RMSAPQSIAAVRPIDRDDLVRDASPYIGIVPLTHARRVYQLVLRVMHICWQCRGYPAMHRAASARQPVLAAMSRMHCRQVVWLARILRSAGGRGRVDLRAPPVRWSLTLIVRR